MVGYLRVAGIKALLKHFIFLHKSILSVSLSKIRWNVERNWMIELNGGFSHRFKKKMWESYSEETNNR